ncbi:MAG: EAL domain-containing protein [Lautropia sp.]|nr:EAL domain-containing protein [Lautropia sp.]
MKPEVHISVGTNHTNRSEDVLILKQTTVLLLDADPVTQEIVRQTLHEERLGELHIANNFPAAEQFISTHPAPALMLVSLDPCDQTALAWLSARLKDPAWQHLSIILLASGPDHDLWQHALRLNLADVLFKPLDRAALVLKLRQSLALKLYRDRLLKQDLLTGLSNRSGFMRRLEVVLRMPARSHTLMLLDLDRFRQLNDSLGHRIGDAFLKAVSQRLNDIVTRFTGPERRRPSLSSSPWLARTGADRFMALLPGRPGDPVHDECLQALQRTLALPLHLEGKELFISASIGLAVFPDHARDHDQLTRSAERALAVAKRRGGHRTEYFDPSQQSIGINALALENHLRHAIRHNELQLVYQPKICSQSLRITGVEALIRWYHRDRGLILPEHFVPIAERSGQIAEIGAWALETACQQGRAWMDAGLPPLKIAVNISAAQTLRGNLVATVEQALRQSGLPPEQLTLELTETLLVENGDQARLLINALKELGLKLSLDDFGTGYSSLTYLHTLPFDEIKIDRSFIQGLPHQSVSKAIVHAILALASGLKLDAVAEGIERTEEFNCLQEASPQCTLQGNLFCPPMSADNLLTRLRHSTCFAPQPLPAS